MKNTVPLLRLRINGSGIACLSHAGVYALFFCKSCEVKTGKKHVHTAIILAKKIDKKKN
jgi:hypothetical protein